MADPRERINNGLRALKTPPPPRPSSPEPTAEPAPDSPAPVEAEQPEPAPESPAPQPKSVATKPAAAPAPRRQSRARQPKAQPVADDELIGRPLGNKRSVVVYVPGPIRERLDEEVEGERATKGLIIMRALREAYPKLSNSAPADDGGGVGPFPAERHPSRRRGPAKVQTTFTLWPDEVQAVQQVATEITGGNVSALVSDALALRYQLAVDKV